MSKGVRHIAYGIVQPTGAEKKSAHRGVSEVLTPNWRKVE